MSTPGTSGRPAGAHRHTGDARTHPATTDILTPPSLLVALGALKQRPDGEYVLGPDPFDLDACASLRQPWPTARTMWTRDVDGTAHGWNDYGEVWLNPPYGAELYSWLALLAHHGTGTALLYARTDTRGFGAHVWNRADAIFFFSVRLWFHEPVTGHQLSQNCGGPMVLAIYGEKSLKRARRLTAKNSPYPGTLVRLRT